MIGILVLFPAWVAGFVFALVDGHRRDPSTNLRMVTFGSGGMTVATVCLFLLFNTKECYFYILNATWGLYAGFILAVLTELDGTTPGDITP